MEQFLFLLFSLVACGGALAVVLSQNVVRMAFCLVISLGAVAGLFFLLHADFVAATQLLIYVGGTVVLLIFGVMLTSSSPFHQLQTSAGDLLKGGLVGVGFLLIVSISLLAVNWTENEHKLAEAYPDQVAQSQRGYNQPGEGNTSRSIGSALLGLRFDRDLDPSVTATDVADQEGADQKNNEELSTGYLLAFEIISIHLLVVLIGAAYLARAKRRESVASS